MNAPVELLEWIQENPGDAASELYEHRLKAMADADELTPEQEADIKTAVAQLEAGLDQMRSELNMPWNLVNRKRMHRLAEILAAVLPDWSVYDVLLVGTFLAGSARQQIMADESRT